MEKRGGFTLIELMIVVCIMGILAAIAIPQFAKMIDKSKEGACKANLGTIRSALSVYYADTEGQYPQDDLSSLKIGAKYLQGIPMKYTPPWHPPGNDVSVGDDAAQIASRGDWFYWNIPSDPKWGQIVVNCIHTDSKGVVWTSY